MPGALNHSPAQIIQQVLLKAEFALGTTPAVPPSAWPIYFDDEPDQPGSVITVYDTDSTRQGRLQYSGQVLERAGFQVRIRAQQHSTGVIKADAIKQVLDESIYQEVVTVGSGSTARTYLLWSVSRTSGVLRLGKEEGTKRRLFTINGTATIRMY